MKAMSDATVRRELRPGDLGAILEHHGRVYAREHGVDSSFEAHVAATLANAALRGFPQPNEAIWIVEHDGVHAGSFALTDSEDGVACARWFLLDPAVRGRGLGRQLVDELVAAADEAGYERIVLETFSDLRAAAHLYRSRGFRVTSAETGPRWGRAEITYQSYELELPADPCERAVSSERATKPIV
jgi:ribosomal protein S18 acetylase RimI-like enzyme